jgi:hypothetical protein
MAVHLADEGAVDLERVDGQAAQVAERGIPVPQSSMLTHVVKLAGATSIG